MLNLVTSLGDVDLVVTPAGALHGYEQLREGVIVDANGGEACRQQVVGRA